MIIFVTKTIFYFNLNIFTNLKEFLYYKFKKYFSIFKICRLLKFFCSFNPLHFYIH